MTLAKIIPVDLSLIFARTFCKAVERMQIAMNFYSNPHHIESAAEKYNILADYIIQSFLVVFPDRDINHYALHQMIDELVYEAQKGKKYQDQLVKQANDSINSNFAAIHALWDKVEKNGE